MTIQRLLVANRGEIASRVFRTCRRLGIETVAVHSDADAQLPFVREADVAVLLPGNIPAETYLRGDLIIDAARKAGADAIHPGYGFLSENADFARSVIDAGLTWVGPDPKAIDQMGSKIEAKALMTQAGVPVLESVHVEDATEAQLPLLVKASAGGGGRGMRIVRSLADLPGEVEKAEAEALSAFGDGTVFVEPYVERGRHVEVQVWGDAEASIAVLGERDCSIQRRHQKVVEEAPAPGKFTGGTRDKMHKAAKAAAETIGYQGVGTVEFLYDEETERFFFLEMNTRLQVEHPVTEMVFHQDLVELQLRTAEGGRAKIQFPEKPDGCAIEVRLYAEDPAEDYQPQSGLLTRFEIPTGNGVRVDSGFESGSEVSTHYDAMLAKVIAYAPTRHQAARKLAAALANAEDPRRRHQPGPARRDPARPGLPGRQGQHGVPGRVHHRPVGNFATGQRFRGGSDRAGRAGGCGQDGAARPPGRLAQRGVAAAAHRVRHGEVVVEWHGGRAGYTVDGHSVIAASPTAGHARDRRRPHDVRRRRQWRRGRRRLDRTATCASTGCRGSSTRPTPWPAAACWHRCPAPSSRSWSSREPRSPPATPCSCSRP